MEVTVKLFANLREHLPEGSQGNACVMEIDDGATVKELLDRLKIPGDIKLIILLNSAHAEKDAALKNGDVLAVFPPLAGG